MAAEVHHRALEHFRLAGLATDWLWFREIHFESVFVTSLGWRVALFAIGALLAFAFVYGNVRLATR